MYRAQDNNIGYYHQVLAEASATWLGNHMTPDRMSASLRRLDLCTPPLSIVDIHWKVLQSFRAKLTSPELLSHVCPKGTS